MTVYGTDMNTLQGPVILLASARKNSDTEKYLDVLLKGIEHTRIDLLDYCISPYTYSHDYPVDDNFTEIMERVLTFDKIIFATPVYWYSMSGLLKTFFDRFTDLVTFQKQIGRRLAGKTTALFAVGAEAELPGGFEIPFQATSIYLKMNYAGGLYYSTKQLNPGFDTRSRLFFDQLNINSPIQNINPKK